MDSYDFEVYKLNHHPFIDASTTHPEWWICAALSAQGDDEGLAERISEFGYIPERPDTFCNLIHAVTIDDLPLSFMILLKRLGCEEDTDLLFKELYGRDAMYIGHEIAAERLSPLLSVMVNDAPLCLRALLDHPVYREAILDKEPSSKCEKNGDDSWDKALLPYSIYLSSPECSNLLLDDSDLNRPVSGGIAPEGAMHALAMDQALRSFLFERHSKFQAFTDVARKIRALRKSGPEEKGWLNVYVEECFNSFSTLPSRLAPPLLDKQEEAVRSCLMWGDALAPENEPLLIKVFGEGGFSRIVADVERDSFDSDIPSAPKKPAHRI